MDYRNKPRMGHYEVCSVTVYRMWTQRLIHRKTDPTTDKSCAVVHTMRTEPSVSACSLPARSKHATAAPIPRAVKPCEKLRPIRALDDANFAGACPCA